MKGVYIAEHRDGGYMQSLRTVRDREKWDTIVMLPSHFQHKKGKIMFKKNSILLFLLVIGIEGLFAETLTIRVENAEPGKGHLMVGLFNNENSFPDDYFAGQRMAVTDRLMVVTFTDLPEGMYAVSVYQDNNGNEQLDKNIFGIPKEKYGFSNNASRPDYKNCLFYCKDTMTITVRLR
jgi:uncharacterized protein (DUF2141 family)